MFKRRILNWLSKIMSRWTRKRVVHIGPEHKVKTSNGGCDEEENDKN